MKSSILREEIDQLILAHAAGPASTCLNQLWREEAGPSAAGFVVSRYEQLRQSFQQTLCRLFILRSFTVEPVVPLLRAAAFVNEIDLTVQVGGFNAYAPEILDPNSRLYSFAPQVAILAVQTRDVAPTLWDAYARVSAEEAKAVIEEVVANFQNWILAFRSHSKAALVVHTLEVPPVPTQGILDHQLETSQISAIQEINQRLRRLAGEQTGVYVLDYDSLIARYGRIGWSDEHKWLTMRMPIAATNLVHLANEWLRFVHPLSGKICKALVTDLDNTLWGGIIGEDGIEGIQLGNEHPGASFQALQGVMLDLYHRGIILAVCSKNNVADAMEALEKHPGMLLKPDHFATLRINWSDKAQNLREIAAELNIGIDTLAFLDDNPVERMRIRTELPEVTVIELPNDPSDFSRALRDAPVFERLSLSEEDRERGRYYAEQRQRVELERSASSLEDFYRSLKQEVEMASVTPGTVTRIAQLTQKTNQFNLTTRRYNEQQIAEMAASSAWNVYSIRVKDRFGDNGIVGVAITHDSEGACEINTLLLSCRVVGRTVETALVAFLLDQARTRNMKQIRGWFLPTKKNDLSKDFYALHGFQCLTVEDGKSLWSLDLEDTDMRCPEWIKVTACEGVMTL